MASQFTGQTYMMDYTSSLNLSWEVDIWGKIKGQQQESLIDLLKTEEAVHAVKTRLVSEVVTGYYNLLMLDKQLSVSRENLLFADSTLLILKKQHALGLASLVAVQQQEMSTDQLQKSIPEIERAIHVQENALSVLAGNYPGKVERQQGLDQVIVPEGLETGVPANLLSYRPDVRSRELDLRRSLASIHIARVSMYPVLNITAQGGLNALMAENWFNIPGSLFGTAAGAIAQPLLNGRQLKTRFKQAEISGEQAALHFRQSVLSAAAEVSDALIQIKKIEEQEVVSERMVQRAADLVDNSLKLYTYSEATYLEVIVAHTAKLQAELDLAAVKAQKLNAIATLYRSLGGGWL
ncbi:TolC family protein [Sphingobacterium bambusae]|uniref:TolC family protein n=1 Tax=Sphingobacterium bambusae TaxID=662858 RepID=A0ABW6BDE1_9SPHI|nr:TolC family protein [Sphingobacterium bambusae]WPL48768.1 TolC family protein [Sphingobacterium bambusae]